MIKKISFGKVDGYHINKRNCEITLEIGFREFTGQKPYFSVCANLWNNKHTDIITGGQCIDILYNEFKSLHSNKLYIEIMDLWQKYHLKNIDTIPQKEIDRINKIISMEV